MDLWILHHRKPKTIKLSDNRSFYLKTLRQAFIPKNYKVRNDFIGNIQVSTVFLQYEHPGGNFETMIFGGEYDQFQIRAETHREALYNHRRAKSMVRELKWLR